MRGGAFLSLVAAAAFCVTRAAAQETADPAGAYGDSSAALYDTTDLTIPEVRFRRAGPVLRWNMIAREAAGRASAAGGAAAEAFYVGNNNTRLLALVHGAQYDALRAAERRSGPTPRADASAHAAAAAAASAILAKVFPGDTALFERELEAERTRLRQAGGGTMAMTAGEVVGREAARRWLDYAADELRSRRWTGAAPAGPGYWVTDGRAPGLAASSLYRTWFLASGRQLRPPPPPAYGSPEFAAALAEVRRATEERTRAETKATWNWARNAASIWAEIAGEMILEHRLAERDAARALAYLNMAVSDAIVACWDAKLAYWSIRPSQADSTIELSVPLPNFPSYPSGHATIFAAGATVLAHFLPDERTALDSIASEVAMSRLWAGLHYRFDNEVGARMGREVGRLAVAAAERESAETSIRPVGR